jgi:hypothetical protein
VEAIVQALETMRQVAERHANASGNATTATLACWVLALAERVQQCEALPCPEGEGWREPDEHEAAATLPPNSLIQPCSETWTP